MVLRSVSFTVKNVERNLHDILYFGIGVMNGSVDTFAFGPWNFFSRSWEQTWLTVKNLNANCDSDKSLGLLWTLPALVL